jgi:hypothetical protein
VLSLDRQCSSVHLHIFDNADKCFPIDNALEMQIQDMINVINLIRFVRSENKLSQKIPLRKVIVCNNDINVQNNTKFYYSHQTNVAGRGFGNLDTSNDIHFSNSSRNNSQEWKQYKEGIIIDRFEYIDSNIQNPKHHVMNDIPRGGISTRKQNTTHIQNTLSRENKDFTFTY